jgi:hypothetical protein
MAKKAPAYPDAVHFNFQEILKVVDVSDVKFVEFLEGDERRDFCKFCHETFHSPFYAQVIKCFLWAQVMKTADGAVTHDEFWGGKMMCQGIKTIDDFFLKYAKVYDVEFTGSREKFDPSAPFSKVKI